MLTPAYQPHEQRVIAEKAELEVKIAALQAFTLSPRMKALDPVDQADLDAQLWSMREYAAILGRRIARFEPSTVIYKGTSVGPTSFAAMMYLGMCDQPKPPVRKPSSKARFA